LAYRRVEYHPHARKRMVERKIGEHQVARTIAEPATLVPSQSHPERLIAERPTAAGNTIRVVYEERDAGATAFVWTVIRKGGVGRGS